jgi:tetratricopeptide (TPR) repeat protein
VIRSWSAFRDRPDETPRPQRPRGRASKAGTGLGVREALGAAAVAALVGLLAGAGVHAEQRPALAPSTPPAARGTPVPSATKPIRRPRSAPKIDPNLAFRDALELEHQGKLQDAINAYRAVVATDSGYPEAFYRLGRVYASQDRLLDAARAYANELRFHPDHVMSRMGNSKQAISTLERLTRMRPDDDQGWQALAFAYSLAGRLGDAETALRRAIANPPERAEEHRDLGVVLTALGRDEDARAEYQAAIALDDRDPASWINLGNLERRAGHTDRALEDYRAAEAADSSSALALQGQIAVLDSLGRYPEAGAAVRRWLRVRPDDHRARLDAVRIFRAAGLPDEALEVAREGVALYPRSGDAHVVLSSILDVQGDLRGALRELRTAARLFTDPINRGNAVQMERGTLAEAPDSIRVLARQDSLAEVEELRREGIER